MSRYIDGLEQHVINQLKSIENVVDEELMDVSSAIQKMSLEIEMENESLKGEKSMKALINHISANLSEYYSYHVSEISHRIRQVKNYELHVER